MHKSNSKWCISASEIKGKPVVLDLEYKGTSPEEKKDDEVEDLYELLKKVKVCQNY